MMREMFRQWVRGQIERGGRVRGSIALAVAGEWWLIPWLWTGRKWRAVFAFDAVEDTNWRGFRS